MSLVERRQAPEGATGCQTPDEDAAVEEMTLHANAIPEDRSPRERAGGIDRQDAHRLTVPPKKYGYLIDQSALADPG